LQAPQLVALCVTQLDPQHSCIGTQVLEPHKHWPPEQTSPLRQRLPHVPQLFGSFEVLAQPAAQQLSPPAQMVPLQAQAPPEQASGAVQR
jgi:hypothetical protein